MNTEQLLEGNVVIKKNHAFGTEVVAQLGENLTALLKALEAGEYLEGGSFKSPIQFDVLVEGNFYKAKFENGFEFKNFFYGVKKVMPFNYRYGGVDSLASVPVLDGEELSDTFDGDPFELLYILDKEYKAVIPCSRGSFLEHFYAPQEFKHTVRNVPTPIGIANIEFSGDKLQVNEAVDFVVHGTKLSDSFVSVGIEANYKGQYFHADMTKETLIAFFTQTFGAEASVVEEPTILHAAKTEAILDAYYDCIYNTDKEVNLSDEDRETHIFSFSYESGEIYVTSVKALMS